MDLARYLLDQAEIFTRSSGYLARSKKMGTNLARGDIGERRRRRQTVKSMVSSSFSSLSQQNLSFDSPPSGVEDADPSSTACLLGLSWFWFE